MNEQRRAAPTRSATGIQSGASAVSDAHNTKYAEMVMTRRPVGDTDVECENASACTNEARRRPSVGRIALRFRQALPIYRGYGAATIEAINPSNEAACSATVALGPMNLM